jgi:hypothetical protein
MGGRFSLAQARSATLTFASEAMAAAASLEKSRPVKFLIKGLPDLALSGPLVLMPVKHWSLFDIYISLVEAGDYRFVRATNLPGGFLQV